MAPSDTDSSSKIYETSCLRAYYGIGVTCDVKNISKKCTVVS